MSKEDTDVYLDVPAGEPGACDGYSPPLSVGDRSKIGLEDNEGKKKSQATLLIEIADQIAELFHDHEQEAYSVIRRRGMREVFPVRSKAFTEFLSGEFFRLTGKGCNRNAVADALNTIEAKAKARHDPQSVYIRVARLAGRVLIDLCDEAWRVIEVTADGWRILNESTLYFVRKRGMTAFPVPVAGDIHALRGFLTLGDEAFTLLVSWMVASLAGIKPYPVLVLQGEQGTGKSFLTRILRALVDPSTVPLRSPPRELRDLLVSATNNHLVVLDNLSGLSPEISDALCRLSTGGGIDARQLYTDLEQVLVDIQRPVLVNGIDDIATRPDLAERAIILTLPTIDPAKRADERTLIRDFEAALPGIFGALLDGIAGALKYLPDIHIERLPRMADFALWAVAVERAFAFEPGAFLRAYGKNQDKALESGIEASPVGSAVLALMEARERWTGTPSNLLAELAQIAGDQQTRSRAWPQSTKGLKNALRRLAPSFRRMGIEIEDGKGGDGGRFYSIVQARIYPPYPPYPPEAANSVDPCTALTAHSTAHTAHSKSYPLYPEVTAGKGYGTYGAYGAYSAPCVNAVEGDL